MPTFEAVIDDLRKQIKEVATDNENLTWKHIPPFGAKLK